MLTAVVGINWGDEGKGRIVDLLSRDQDIVVRYQGGNNAGHTVINEKGEFILNLLPSGILRDDVVCVMGNGMAIDLHHLHGEIEKLREKGIKISPENLKISDRAIITMPYHVDLDCFEEERLGGAGYGSTKRGIAPVYSDKYAKKAIRTGDLFHKEYLKEHLKSILDFKNLTIEKVYGKQGRAYDEMLEYLETYGEEFRDYICDTGVYLRRANAEGKRIMFEAQLGASTAPQPADRGASARLTLWRQDTVCAFRAATRSRLQSSTCFHTWIRSLSARHMSITVRS